MSMLLKDRDRMMVRQCGYAAFAETSGWGSPFHSFHVVKNLFNHRKARYRGLAKNGAPYDTCLRWAIW
jgi:hypothetical protein